MDQGVRPAGGQAVPAKSRRGASAGDASLLLPSSLSWTLLLYAALVLATGWAYSAQRIRTDREQTYQSESNRLRAVAAALEQSAFAMISDGVGSAVTRANQITAAGGLSAVSERDLSPALSQSMSGGQYVRSVFVTDAARFARAGRAGSFDVSRVPPSWFSPPASQNGVWIGAPVADPDRPAGAAGQDLLVPIARRVLAPADADLWAGALFDFRAFEALRTQLGGPGGVIALVALDGTLLAAMEDAPRHLSVGSNYASAPAFQQGTRYLASGWDSGTIESYAPAYGTRLVFAFAQLRQYPALIITARPLEAILAPWHERTTTTLAVTGAFSALVLAMTFLLSHSLRALRNREMHYRTLFNNAAFSVLLGEGDRFITANDAALRLFGLADQEALRAVTPEQLSPPEQPGGRPSARVRRERNEQAMRDGNATFEWLHRRVDTGATFPAKVDLGILREGKTLMTLAVVHDLTEAKRAEQQEEAETARSVRMQRQSDVLLRIASRASGSGGSAISAALEGICADAAAVLATDRVAIWLLEDEGVTLSCAAIWERGEARHGELPRFPMSHLSSYIAMLRTERVFTSADVASEPRLQGFSDLTRPLAASRAILAAAIWRGGDLAGVVSASQLDGPRTWYPDEANFVGAVADQVAQVLLDFERERVLADLQVLAGELVHIQNEERRRIGRELHDSTGQTLAALELDLARLSEAARSLAAKPRELLDNAVRLARQCSTEIRTASYLLHPPLLDELGLVSALRWLADGLRERSGIELRLELPESMPRLSGANELTLFRVAQEALTNVQRHAASPWVALRLEAREHSVSLEVEDAGRGIARRDTHARGAPGVPALGVGLAGMRERIRQVGGTFAVESAGAGTRIRATVPLQSLSEARSA